MAEDALSAVISLPSANECPGCECAASAIDAFGNPVAMRFRCRTSRLMPRPGQGFPLEDDATGIDDKTWVTKLASLSGDRSSWLSNRYFAVHMMY